MRKWRATSPKETAAYVVDWLPRVVNCPGNEACLERALAPVESLLLFDGDLAVAWIAILESELGPMLDIAVSPEWHGKWLTRDVLRQAGKWLFANRDFLLMEKSQGKALKFALRMGANHIKIPGKKEMYVLSAASFNGRLH